MFEPLGANLEVRFRSPIMEHSSPALPEVIGPAQCSVVACEVQHLSHENGDQDEHMIKAVTIDLWGTLVVDSPATDERYRRERLTGLESTLARFGFRVPVADLAPAYSESGRPPAPPLAGGGGRAPAP